MATLLLSPHFDDAVLSCWHLLDGEGEVRVVNVFGGVPADGAFGWWDLAAGMGASSGVVELRRAEDRAALAMAGRDAVDLDFLDAQYRDSPQPVEAVVERLRELLGAGDSLWAPASLATDGHLSDPHPDHLTVRGAGLALRAEGWPLTLYADLPHASARGLPAWVTGRRNGTGDAVAARWRACLEGLDADPTGARIRRLSGRALARKLEAVRLYASQVGVLQRGFGRPLEAPELLDHEIVWRLA